MNLNTEIYNKIEQYNIQRLSDKKNFKEFVNLQRKFVTDFPKNKLLSLTLDEYIEGKGSKTSFCYRIERQLDKIGNMRGSTSNVFVVYYGKKGKDLEYRYRFTSKLGKVANEDEAFEKVKVEIEKLITSGEKNDREAIIKNKLADLFKYKILGTYFPEKYLNLYSHRHIDYFIGELGLIHKESNLLDKQDCLMSFKNSDLKMQNWSNYEFNSFLYTCFGYPPSNDDEALKMGVLPSIAKIKPIEIDLKILEIEKHSFISKRKGTPKPDYAKIEEQNTKIGMRGELIVIAFETAFLIANGLDSSRVIHSSKDDDRLGYDIQSVDTNGSVKYIEVKSTRHKPDYTNFIITENELTTARNLENYYIYIVYEAHTLTPKIWKIKEPFKLYNDKISLTPINYSATIKTQ